MKIAVLCHASAGGSGVVATELGLEVAAAGHEVHFVGAAQPFRLSGYGGMHGPYFHQVGGFAYALFDQPYPELAAANTLTEVILEHGVELTHAHYAIPHASAGLHARSITGKTRVMTTLHGTDVTLVGAEPAFRHTTGHAIERSDHVTAVSQFLADQTREVFGTEREIEVIYNFVDSERFTRITDAGVRARFAHPDEALIVHVSNFRPVKRVQDVVEVFARVSSEIPARLLMVGDGDLFDAMSRRAGPTIELVRRMPFDRLRTAYAEARGLIFTAEEDFGIVPVEAMASGRPVLAYARGGALDTVVPGVSGQFFGEQSAQSLADSLEAFEHWLPDFDPEGAVAHARNFRPELFDRRLLDVLLRT